MAAVEAQLMLSVGLIEKDTNGDALWVWCYPSVSAELRELLLRKCCLTAENKLIHTFVFGQFRRTWYYISTVGGQDAAALKKVTHFSIVLTAKDFNPEKYAAFSRVLCRMYIKHGSPVRMMESYIAVLTKGVCQSDENGSFLIRDYDVRKAYLAGSIKDVVSQFGIETIILYTALMLKKRIVVHHPRIEALQEFTRALPALVWHRKDWSILHPYVHLNDNELHSLKVCTGYVAGFTDPEVSSRSDLYDVYVNLQDSEITVLPHAKEAMTMGKLHKDVGQLIIQSAEDPERSDSQVIKDISVKTREILTSLASLAETTENENSKITLEMLQQRRFPPATENFLYHLAAAEQMLKI
ncbi:DENN domain-containing protein 10 isoform X1 [Polyodon spathula]|uniref:DENN domain-containing protein 10 isoform X1 n=2 Tax=Polyodon spathula TaxID=7913 RepID=UPI001B7E86B8|nr:DENN domain-containing protein 10 isoform X1 [Polyodon spathula]